MDTPGSCAGHVVLPWPEEAGLKGGILSMVTKTKRTVTLRAEDLLAGVKKHYANVPSLTFASATHTIQEITQGLQSLIDLRTAVDDARSAVKEKLAVEQAQAPSILGMMADLTAFLRATFSKSPADLADFGISKKARAVLTGAEA